MEERKNIFQNKKLLIILPVLLVVVALIGVTYAFFNFTRTGGENSLGTGRIYFNTSETRTVSLTSMFPVDENDLDPSTLASTSVRIVGDTTYSGGEEYLVTLTDVHNTINNKTVPIHYIATYTASSGKTVGDESNDYFNDRGSTSNVYTLSEEGVVTEGERILIGFLKEGETGIDGILTIKAWISNDDVAISDTYNEENPETDTNGTTTEWVGNRVVVTTTEWNGFMGNGALSFKIKTESNEGTWVRESNSSTPAAVPTVLGCDGCQFMFAEFTGYYSFESTLADIVNNGGELVDDYTELNSNHFLGFKFDEVSGNITNAYACGIKGEDPNNGVAFCIEGSSDGSTFTANKNLITGATLWNDSDGSAGRCTIDGGVISCNGSAWTHLVSGYGSAQVYGYFNEENHVCEAGPDIYCDYPG